MTEVDHTKVAPTAWGVSYLRTFTDIPLSQEVFKVLNKHIQASGEGDISKSNERDHLAPQLEARYKLVEKLIAEKGTRQIIELAAGVATHGINLTRSHPDITYVEVDLPAVSSEKRAIFDEMNLELPKNLVIQSGNALNEDDIRRATEVFSKDSAITVVNEGLLRYLTFDEKAQLAGIVHRLLAEFGGVWITPDISMRQGLSRENEAAAGHTERLKQTTGIDIDKNVFENLQHARDFFGNLGFKVEEYSYLEVTGELVSPRKLNMSDEAVRRTNDPYFAFVMTVK